MRTIIAALCLIASPALADAAFAPYSDGAAGMKANSSHRGVGGSMLPQEHYRGPQPVYRVHVIPQTAGTPESSPRPARP